MLGWRRGPVRPKHDAVFLLFSRSVGVVGGPHSGQRRAVSRELRGEDLRRRWHCPSPALARGAAPRLSFGGWKRPGVSCRTLPEGSRFSQEREERHFVDLQKFGATWCPLNAAKITRHTRVWFTVNANAHLVAIKATAVDSSLVDL